MELFLRRIAKVDSADIVVDSVTVVAGYNGSGKTTVSKALYGMLRCSSGDKLDNAFISSEILRLYSTQAVTHHNEGIESEISLRDGKNVISFSLSDDDLKINSYYPIGNNGNAIYFRAPSRWIDSDSEELKTALYRPSLRTPSSLMESYKSLIEKYAKGTIKEHAGKLYYVDADYPDFYIELSNASSGAIILAEIGRLIDNGSIKSGTTLIIDEPETNLHPEKQVALARIIVSLAVNHQIRFLLSSHNIYFIRALEVALSEEQEERHRFYMMVQSEESHLYSSRDVTDDLEQIYRELYQPLEDL